MTQPTTWREREQAARWDAAEELQRAGDDVRELRLVGLMGDVEMARLRAAEQAWDRVRGAS